MDFDAVLNGVKRVAEKAAAQRAEIDAARKFPLDLFEEIEATGAFKLLQPKEYGGLDLSLKEMNQLVFEGARGLGSLGWLMMVGTASSIGSGLFPEETVRKITTEFPNLRIRGVIAPKGVAVPVEGGYRISGRWPFGTGGPNPTHVAGNCLIVDENGKPKFDENGDPQMVIAMAPADKGKFLDTWHVLGMRGTDSVDIQMDDVFVSEAMTYNLHHMHCVYDIPAAHLPLRVTLSFPHCAVALGIAQGAIDDLVELGKTKRSSMNPKQLLSEDPVYRHEFGQMILRYEAANALLDQFTDRAWQAGVEGRELTPREILTCRLMANHITNECIAIVDWAYTRVGSSSLYDGSSLQTRFRDIHVASQHASCHTDAYRHLGAAMNGVELTPRELF
ncbi:MAG TPA: acyl-CoA dehydrogenase family protein [Novosphingobium sp.]